MARKRKFKSYTKAIAIVHAELTNEKEKQLQADLEYCKLHTKRRYSAIKHDICSLIFDARIINAHFDGKWKGSF